MPCFTEATVDLTPVTPVKLPTRLPVVLREQCAPAGIAKPPEM
jgi:hypothetical protein